MHKWSDRSTMELVAWSSLWVLILRYVEGRFLKLGCWLIELLRLSTDILTDNFISKQRSRYFFRLLESVRLKLMTQYIWIFSLLSLFWWNPWPNLSLLEWNTVRDCQVDIHPTKKSNKVDRGSLSGSFDMSSRAFGENFSKETWALYGVGVLGAALRL